MVITPLGWKIHDSLNRHQTHSSRDPFIKKKCSHLKFINKKVCLKILCACVSSDCLSHLFHRSWPRTISDKDRVSLYPRPETTRLQMYGWECSTQEKFVKATKKECTLSTCCCTFLVSWRSFPHQPPKSPCLRFLQESREPGRAAVGGAQSRTMKNDGRTATMQQSRPALALALRIPEQCYPHSRSGACRALPPHSILPLQFHFYALSSAWHNFVNQLNVSLEMEEYKSHISNHLLRLYHFNETKH